MYQLDLQHACSCPFGNMATSCMTLETPRTISSQDPQSTDEHVKRLYKSFPKNILSKKTNDFRIRMFHQRKQLFLFADFDDVESRWLWKLASHLLKMLVFRPRKVRTRTELVTTLMSHVCVVNPFLPLFAKHLFTVYIRIFL